MIQSYKKQVVQNPNFPLYWEWKSAIPDYLIQCLEHEIKDLPRTRGGTFANPSGEMRDSVRNTDVMMFDPIHWFSGILFNLALASNIQSEWNMSILAPESLQIAFYGTEQHYAWHQDSITMSRDEIIRKLSVVCMLSDSSDYEGGKFELDECGEINLQKGDVIVFPSFMKHRVTPVTSGIRKTAVIWVSGYRSW